MIDALVVAGPEERFEFNTISLSSTRSSDTFNVVVSPETVKFPGIVKSPVLVKTATVPAASGNVIVRSAVGFVTVRVVSKASADDPSKIILDFGTSKLPSTSNFAGPPALPTSANNT